MSFEARYIELTLRGVREQIKSRIKFTSKDSLREKSDRPSLTQYKNLKL